MKSICSEIVRTMSLPIKKPFTESATDNGPKSEQDKNSEDEDIFENIDRRLNQLLARATKIENALNKLNEANNNKDDVLDMDANDMGFDENAALNVNLADGDFEGDSAETEYSDFDIDGTDFLDDDPLENAGDGLIESFDEIDLNVHDD